MAAKDYRQAVNRLEYFTAIYKSTLENKVSPGLVYLYMPALAERYGWDDEQKLWFAFLNGMTQNPITSLVLLERLPECPTDESQVESFTSWFNARWAALQFDTDRRYSKKDTPAAIRDYGQKVSHVGSQKALLGQPDYQSMWKVANSFVSFGRLSTFSYLEYIYLNELGPDCDDLMFSDKSGSKSHRNGMLLLLGKDRLVWDKRAQNGFDGQYEDFPGLCALLADRADQYLEWFKKQHPDCPDAGRFTLESALCAFKNSFFSRRYMGVYADMAWDRILWAEEHGWGDQARVFKEIREDKLPAWLRLESEVAPVSRASRAAQFAETGVPYRAEHFLT